MIKPWLSFFFYKEGELMGKFVQVWMIAMIHISSSKMPTAPAPLLGGEFDRRRKADCALGNLSNFWQPLLGELGDWGRGSEGLGGLEDLKADCGSSKH